MKQPEEMKPRDRILNTVNGIKMLKEMLAPVHNKYRFGMPITTKHVFEEVQNALRALRKSLRREQSPKTWVEKAKIRVTEETQSAVNHLMSDRRRTRWDLVVGGPANKTGHAYKSLTYTNRINLCLGLRWHSKVYLPLIFSDRLLGAKNIFVLSAMEYRVNVRGVRLYAVNVWDFLKKEEAIGYIGQSTYTNRTIFKKTKTEAINAAQSLTVKSVDEKLGVNK